MSQTPVHGIDHVGLTVPDIEQATTFFIEALQGEVLYETLKKTEPKRDDAETQQRLGVPDTMAQRAIRMLVFPNGPGIELFEFEGPDQKGPICSSDIGWTHIAFYTDDLEKTLANVEAAGGKRLADPQPLSGLEAGKGNRFCYVHTPWGSTLEIITYPTPQPYLEKADRAKWQV